MAIADLLEQSPGPLEPLYRGGWQVPLGVAPGELAAERGLAAAVAGRVHGGQRQLDDMSPVVKAFGQVEQAAERVREFPCGSGQARHAGQLDCAGQEPPLPLEPGAGVSQQPGHRTGRERPASRLSAQVEVRGADPLLPGLLRQREAGAEEPLDGRTALVLVGELTRVHPEQVVEAPAHPQGAGARNLHELRVEQLL